MLVGSAVRRVAIIGGVRIPFARSYTAYASVSNQDMLTAALRGLVERFRLQGERLGDVAAGAVIKHSKDYNLMRESVLSSGLDPQTPGLDLQRACGTSLEAADRHRQQDRARPDRGGHRRRRGLHQRRADRLPALLPAAAAGELPRAQRLAAPVALAAPAAAPLPAGAAGGGRAAHRAVDGSEHRAHGQALADHARRAGPARLREPREGGGRLAARASTTTWWSTTWG